jgi:hypothetical protein
MIRHTFSILKGIGEGYERKLWKQGILSWKDFIEASEIGFVKTERKGNLDQALMEAERRLSEGDSAFFARALRGKEHWRLFEGFRDNAVCLDIETNGYPAWAGGYVTVVGLYDGYDYRAFVRGEGLAAEALEKELSGYRYLITFFGSGFDMPFLRESLGVSFLGAHFDLCFGARKVGLAGGLKRLEERMGFERPEDVRGLDGYDAVRLWQEARRGSQEAMLTLVEYNRHDTVNLWLLADTLYKMLRAQTGIEEFLN